MDIELLIQGTGGKIYQPVVEDGITLETNRKGAPSKLTFKVIKDGAISFPEGSKVQLKVDGKGVFIGFVFQKSRDKEQRIEVVAYDQLRYFKNKTTFRYTNKTASEILSMICADYGFSTGTIENTGFKIGARNEVDQTLVDIVLNALDLTVANNKKLFILYDDFGKITLKNAESMKLKTLIDNETAENFDYTSSIDEDTFNQVRLVREDKDTGKREVYLARDRQNIGNWGLLEYTDNIKGDINGQSMADALLKLKNRKTRTLSVKNALGDVNVRAGCSLPVFLDLGDIVTKEYLVCESVTHHFNADYHTMDLSFYDANTFTG